MDDTELEEIYNRQMRTVWNVCYPYFMNEHDTADAVQETFLRLVQGGKNFRDSDHEKAWLITTARNVCKDELKRARRRDVPLEAAAETAAAERERDETMVLLHALPENYRMVLYLYYYEDIPTEQIARLLGRRESTVRTWLRRGRMLLKERLKGGA